MALHRYGGGVSAGAVGAVLRMPFPMLVRLVGAAKRATEPKSAPGRGNPGTDDDAIIRAIEAKEAARAAAKE